MIRRYSDLLTQTVFAYSEQLLNASDDELDSILSTSNFLVIYFIFIRVSLLVFNLFHVQISQMDQNSPETLQLADQFIALLVKDANKQVSCQHVYYGNGI